MITSSPLITMAYMSIVGWLLSGIIGTRGKDECNM